MRKLFISVVLCGSLSACTTQRVQQVTNQAGANMQHQDVNYRLKPIQHLFASEPTPPKKPLSNNIKFFHYKNGKIYQIYCRQAKLTDIVFEENEKIISVAGSDTIDWQVSKTVSGSRTANYQHLIIKPINPDKNDEFIITTNRRTYYVNASSNSKYYLPIVEWNYPQDQKKPHKQSLTKLANSFNNDYQYTIKLLTGDKPDWMPDMVYSHNNKTYIIFPKNSQTAPALFFYKNQLVNYRISKNTYIVDGIIKVAQLRIGEKNPTIVEIKKYR